jgi:hypothetical protein
VSDLAIDLMTLQIMPKLPRGNLASPRPNLTFPSPAEPGLARVPPYVAQVGQARLALGEGGEVEQKRDEPGEGARSIRLNFREN